MGTGPNRAEAEPDSSAEKPRAGECRHLSAEGRMSQILDARQNTRPDGVGTSRARQGSGAKLRTNYGPRRPNSAHINGQPMDISDKWFTLDHGPIWGSRGREFKSRQPD
jgi:hypothetical protein